MSPQINENLLTEIYVETDDLLKAFRLWSRCKALSPLLSPRRTPRLSASEIATILIAYHLSGYKCFEYYYRQCILKTYLHCFPSAPLTGALSAIQPGCCPCCYCYCCTNVPRVCAQVITS